MGLDPRCVSPHFWGELPDSYNRPQRVAFLSKDLSITLVAGYSVQMRHAIVCRWQELEAAQAKPPAQLSRMEILELAMQAEQGRIEAEKKLALAAPKVAFVDKYVQATGLFTFREVAKLLKANEARETPPRAWGRPRCNRVFSGWCGNTPTCVGKTIRAYA